MGGATADATSFFFVSDLFVEATYARGHLAMGTACTGATSTGRFQIYGGTQYEASEVNLDVDSIRISSGGFTWAAETKFLLYKYITDPTDVTASDLVIRDRIRVGAGGEVATGVNSVTFSSGGDGSEAYALAGDTDELYVVKGIAVADSTTLTCRLQPNGSSSSLRHFLHNSDGSGSPTDSTDTNWQTMGYGGATAGTSNAGFTAYIAAKSGKDRSYLSLGVARTGTGGADAGRLQGYGGAWDESVTEITSLVVDSNSAGFRTGSEFLLYTLKASL